MAFKTFSPWLQPALGDRKLWGLHHRFVTRLVHHLAEQPGLPSTVTPLHFQRSRETTSQRDALLALLKTDFIQKSWMNFSSAVFWWTEAGVHIIHANSRYMKEICCICWQTRCSGFFPCLSTTNLLHYTPPYPRFPVYVPVLFTTSECNTV